MSNKNLVFDEVHNMLALPRRILDLWSLVMVTMTHGAKVGSGFSEDFTWDESFYE